MHVVRLPRCFVMVLLVLSGPTVRAGENVAKTSPTPGDSKPDTSGADADAEKLVRQLGDKLFAKRQAADRALSSMGAKAAAAVRAGMRQTDIEVKRRCDALW